MNRAEIIFEKIKAEGLEAVTRLIEDRASEDLYLEFKTSKNNGDNNKIDPRDFSNYTKAISGFGNSGGGVIIWGVECPKDVKTGFDLAKSIKNIIELDRFISFLNDAVSKSTNPSHPLVENYAVKISGNDGIAVSFIPKSDVAPIMDLQTKQYYIRVGSSFDRAPHEVLAAMFGRQPSPNVFPSFHVTTANISERGLFIEFEIVLHNLGKGIARDLFLNVNIDEEFESTEYQISFHSIEEERWMSFGSGFNAISIISIPIFRLPNVSKVSAARYHILIDSNLSADISIPGTCGADGMPPKYFTLKMRRESVNEVFARIKFNHGFKSLDPKGQKNKIYELMKEQKMVQMEYDSDN